MAGSTNPVGSRAAADTDQQSPYVETRRRHGPRENYEHDEVVDREEDELDPEREHDLHEDDEDDVDVDQDEGHDDDDDDDEEVEEADDEGDEDDELLDSRVDESGPRRDATARRSAITPTTTAGTRQLAPSLRHKQQAQHASSRHAATNVQPPVDGTAAAANTISSTADPLLHTTRGARPTPHGRSPTEEEILEQIHRLHAQLELVRETQHADASGDQAHGPDSGDVSTAGEHGPSTPRLIVVSNRLPVTISKDEKGDWHFKVSSGGLVSALAGVKHQIPFIWVGWTGMEVAAADQDGMRQRFQDELSCYPVFLSDQLAHNYYNGFCNDVLWPLFHYVPLPIMGSDGERKFDYKFWEAYSKANHRFAEAVMQIYQPGDLVWVQDYHLMLLPNLLRKRLRNVTIGFFLHTPFPSSEVYRILPVRSLVLQGVLASDVIGFHTYDYARHFLSVCTRILGLEASPRGVVHKNRFVNVGIYPIGIDPGAFKKALSTDIVKRGITNLFSKFRGKKVLLGVDRLDYIKGVPHKLMAFECLLARHPEWKGKVVLIQIAVPSRTEVEEYKKLIGQTNELVGRINGKYSSVEYSPIVFINQSVNFNDLCALYTVADVAVVSSIRDGMNLVSYEYVVCQEERHGVLVLSEFAGSAQSLSSAIRVNPWNIEELAQAFHEALSIPERERELKHGKLYRYVTKHTASYWAQSFVADMQQIAANQQLEHHSKAPHSLLRPSIDLLPEMRRRQHRLIIMDYEGTLCAPAALAEMSVPSTPTRRYLQRLAQDPRNSIYIMSGRSKPVLENWFGDLGVGLVAEHGCDLRHPKNPAWEPLVALHDPAWRDGVIPILQYFTERTPGSYLELKYKVITWHFRDADPTFGSWQAKELQLHLAETCMNLPVEVVPGPKYLELRPVGVTRLAAVERIISELPEPKVDFVFVIGSDKGDEEVFAYVNSFVREADGLCFTLCCHVGKTDVTAADRYVADVDAAFKVLKELAPATTATVTKKAGWSVGSSAGTGTGVPGVGGPEAGTPHQPSGLKRKDPLAAVRQVQRSASFDAIVSRSGITGIFKGDQAGGDPGSVPGDQERSGVVTIEARRPSELSALASVTPITSTTVGGRVPAKPEPSLN